MDSKQKHIRSFLCYGGGVVTRAIQSHTSTVWSTSGSGREQREGESRGREGGGTTGGKKFK